MVLGNTIEFPQVTLGVVPKILYPINMVFVVSKKLAVVDPKMFKARNIKDIIARQAVCIDNAVWHDSLLDYRH